MKVFFVRHGQSQANLNKSFAGQTDTPLTETGRRQAEEIRPVLASISFDKVYSSDLSRAHDTQKIALPGYEADVTKLLREIDVGTLAGQSIPAFIEANGGVSPTANSGDYTPYGGENRKMMDARVRMFLDMLAEQDYENVAVFAHRGVLMAVMRHVLGVEGFPNAAVQCDNCAILVATWDDRNWSLAALNYMREIV